MESSAHAEPRTTPYRPTTVARRSSALALAAIALVLPVLVAGCGDQRAPDPNAQDPAIESTPTTATSVEASELPPPEIAEWDGTGYAPPITLDLDGKRVALSPWAACYDSTCVDGSPRKPYDDVGHRDAVPFSSPDEGWEFETTFKEAGVEKWRAADHRACAKDQRPDWCYPREPDTVYAASWWPRSSSNSSGGRYPMEL